MSRKKMFMVLGVLLISFPGSGQTIQVTGTVIAADTKLPIPFCSITASHSGTASDVNGKFKLVIPAPAANQYMVASVIGFTTDSILIAPSQSVYLITLSPLQTTMNDIVVTGVSNATRIREYPVAVSIVSSKSIERSTESNIIDVLVKNVPGLNAVKTGPNISKPFIRGLGYNRVLVLYDGVRQEGQQWGDEHGLEADPYNIEKAEVIKGPASLLYGSDAVAGVVSLFPSVPVIGNKKINQKYFSEYQSNNGLFGNGFRLSNTSNRFSFALRGSYRIAKNYTSKADGTVYNTGFKEANASVLLQYKYENNISTLNLTAYDNLQGIPDGSRDSLTRRFTKQVLEADADDVKNRPIVNNKELNSYQLSPLHQHIQHFRIYSNHHYELKNGNIDILLAGQQNIRREYNHPTTPQQAGMFVRLNTINYGFRFNSIIGQFAEYSAGINGMYQDNKNRGATDFPIPNYHLFDAGAYLVGKWKQKNWTINAGARYDTRFLSSPDFYVKKDQNTGYNRQVTIPDTTGAYLQFPAFSKTFNGISVSLGATFQLNEHFYIKTNIARGYRAPNITEFASNGLDPGAHIVYLGNKGFVPEFSLQEDIGIEWQHHTINFSIAVFNNNLQHYIYLSQLTDANGNPLVNAQGNKTYQYQQSSAQLYGMEATVRIKPSFIKGFTYDNTFSVTYGYNRGIAFKGRGNNGENLPLIPPARSVSDITQEFQRDKGLFSKIIVKAEADITAMQNRFLALNNTETATPGYNLFNCSISAEIPYGKFGQLQCQFQINNLFNKIYQSHLSRLKYFEYYSQSPAGYMGMYNMGRNICFKLILTIQ